MNKQFLYKMIYYSQASRLYKLSLRRPHCAVLVYHSIRPINAGNELLKDLIVEPDTFERQIVYIKKKYKVISLRQLLESFRKQRKSRDNYVVVTFDDAYQDNYTYAFPILKKYEIPATIFVPTAFVETDRRFLWERAAFMLSRTNKDSLDFQYQGREYKLKLDKKHKKEAFKSILSILKYSCEVKGNEFLDYLSRLLGIEKNDIPSPILSWDEMREMTEYNITFGGHTHTHCCLSLLSREDLTRELYKPKEILERHLNRKITDFAYPFGEKTDFNKETINILKEAGYKNAVTMIQGLAHPDDSLFTLRRIGVGSNDTDEIFKLKLMGLVPFRAIIRGDIAY
jgi:peptidoglycan/xylan/chitin deacetylase (PgdA/CDA1 family)